MIGPLNHTASYLTPPDLTPMYDVDSPAPRPERAIDDLDRFAYRLDYPALCAVFVRLKDATTRRPADLANAPVLHAWIAVLTIEATLLEFARQHAVHENEAYRFFVRMRGRGIPKGPAWELALREIREGVAA